MLPEVLTWTGDMTAADVLAVPAFAAAEFAMMAEMIGRDGVMQMVSIFEAETRQRVLRLAAGEQSRTTVVREMHTLRGAARTVGSPRLAVLGGTFEADARHGRVPTMDQLKMIEDALDAFLSAVRAAS